MVGKSATKPAPPLGTPGEKGEWTPLRPIKGRRVHMCDKAGHPLTLSYPELLVSQGQSSNLQPELDRNNFWTLPIIAKNQNLVGARQPDDGDDDDDDDDKCTFSV